MASWESNWRFVAGKILYNVGLSSKPRGWWPEGIHPIIISIKPLLNPIEVPMNKWIPSCFCEHFDVEFTTICTVDHVPRDFPMAFHLLLNPPRFSAPHGRWPAARKGHSRIPAVAERPSSAMLGGCWGLICTIWYYLSYFTHSYRKVTTFKRLIGGYWT